MNLKFYHFNLGLAPHSFTEERHQWNEISRRQSQQEGNELKVLRRVQDCVQGFSVAAREPMSSVAMWAVAAISVASIASTIATAIAAAISTAQATEAIAQPALVVAIVIAHGVKS